MTAFETVLIAGGVVLFLVLLYEMEVPSQDGSFLNPLLVSVAGLIMLWPLRRHQTVRALLFSGGMLVLLWTMNQVAGILVMFVGVYLMAYLLNPAVTVLRDSYRVPRWLSSLIAAMIAVGVVVLFVLLLAPNIANQIEAFSDRVVGGVDSLRAWLASSTVLDSLEQAGVIEKQEAIGQAQQFIQEQARQLPEAAQRLARSLGSLLSFVTVLALVPVLFFYTLKDYPSIRDAIIGLFPTASGRRDYLVEAGSIVGRYLRGQLVISAIAAFNVSVFLYIFDIPFWLLIGLMAGVLNFIPNLGAIATMIIGGVIALIFGGWIKALILVAVLLGQGLLEQSLLTPNIMSYQVGLHPVLVLFSLLVFGSFLGIFGLLIAVPATAILTTAYRAYREELTLELSDYGTPDEAKGQGSKPLI
ncbi:AI-2E family transporter [Longibacter salinarum]|uniref:AI-2E family transporter n=2 Tax=Longibacter salinarum TaxID=1850348 RepID=A0A2A8CWA2_9BACT|nr:AI-2E family transporter [Longibacter salinarum]